MIRCAVQVTFFALACSNGVQPPSAPAAPIKEKAWVLFETGPMGAIAFEATPPKRKVADFDRIQSGLTLGEVVDIIGPGRIAGGQFLSGCGIVKWTCEDGRVLSIWPTTYAQKEIIDVGPRQIGGTGGRGRMWMQDGKGNDIEFPKAK